MGKRHKVVDGEPNHVAEDRLSDLPDHVICHILSFLPTRRSLQTSVLAKRWRTLWAHVPSIVLFQGEEGDGSSFTTATFSKIVSTVVLRHQAKTLNTFRLKCRGDVDDDYGPLGRYELETCISTVVVERKVQNLDLDLCVEVPRCLFTCKTLVDLTLYGVIIPPSTSGSIYLPNLKKLCLLCLDSKVNFTLLLSGCPVLEDLHIEGTKCSDPRVFCISSPTLKRLTINYLVECSAFHNPDYMLTINTPALGYLQVFDSSSKHISISPCTSLVEANIDMGSLGEPDGRWLLKLLDSVRNVNSLKLSSYVKVCDGIVPGPIAKFGNLTQLRYSADWRFLSKLLESADHLQILNISCQDEYSKHWMEPIEEPRCACLLYSLRTVRLNGFRSEEQCFNMVRYILRNALVLERMEISCRQWPCSVGLEERFDAIQRIALFRRGSVECELAFS